MIDNFKQGIKKNYMAYISHQIRMKNSRSMLAQSLQKQIENKKRYNSIHNSSVFIVNFSPSNPITAIP